MFLKTTMEERVYNNVVGVSRRGGVKRVMGEYQTTLIVSTPCTGAHYKLVYKTFTETTIVLFGRYNVKKRTVSLAIHLCRTEI